MFSDTAESFLAVLTANHISIRCSDNRDRVTPTAELSRNEQRYTQGALSLRRRQTHVRERTGISLNASGNMLNILFLLVTVRGQSKV